MTPPLRLTLPLLLFALFLPHCGMFTEIPQFKEISCQQDEYVRDNFCTPCAPGTTNAPGDDAGGPKDTACDLILCTTNQQVRSNRCFDCPVGTTAPSDADASGPDTTCAPTFCKQDQRVQDNLCTPCTLSATNAAGDPASGPDTACDGMLCLKDQRVIANTCTSCPPGTTAPAGANAAGSDTTCDPILCTPNHAVTTNTCTPCPPGSTRPPGDDASGPNTQCNPVLCALNQRVQSNACVPCDGTDLNEPGDDSSGADTSCVPFAYVEVDTGYTHTCALNVIGGVECWGNNKFGQLGNGTKTDSPRPSKVIGLSSGVVQVSAGLNHTCAVLQNGSMKCWGIDMLVDSEDTAKTYLTPTDFDVSGKSVKQVSVDAFHACAVSTEGEAWCWGESGYAKLGSDTIPPQSDKLIRSSPVKVTGLSSIRRIEAAYVMSCAVTDDDEMYCWGNAGGSLIEGMDVLVQTPQKITGVIGGAVRDFALGFLHICAIRKSTGRLVCWGLNESGQLGDGTTENQPLPDGTPPKPGKPSIPVEKLAAAGGTTCRIFLGLVSCWGAGGAGQLGTGNRDNSLFSQYVPLLEKENSIHLSLGGGGPGGFLGVSYACVVTGAGRIKCWGSNQFGKLGDGSTDDRLTPVDIKL